MKFIIRNYGGKGADWLEAKGCIREKVSVLDFLTINKAEEIGISDLYTKKLNYKYVYREIDNINEEWIKEFNSLEDLLIFIGTDAVVFRSPLLSENVLPVIIFDYPKVDFPFNYEWLK